MVSELRSGVTRVIPAASEAALASNSEKAFAFSFLHALPANENLTFSPHSLIAAFAMLSDAAAGETLEQIEQALHWEATDEAFHRAHGALKLALSARNREAEESGLRRIDAQILTESNDIWLRNDAVPAPSYLDTLARYYGAGVHRADFEHAPEEARRAINGKVESDTHGLISELIPRTAIDGDVVAVLTNALYFKAPWATPFAPPRPGDFYRLDGSTSNVNLLSAVRPLPYYAGNGFVSVALPYYGNDLSMLLIVPDAGEYERVRAKLSGDGLGDILAGQTSELVDLTLPVFKLTTAVPAKETLKELGLTRAFDEETAEFPKLKSEGIKQVHVRAVLHQATVAIDELGTEASAATAIIASGGGSSVGVEPPQPKVVTIDHPFLFVIRDNPTGSLLFVGQVTAP